MICRHYVALSSLMIACVILAVSTGCNQDGAAPVQAASTRPTPEQSFQEIVRLVKEGIELPGSAMSGFVAQKAGASSRFQVHNTVTSQVIPPANADEPYRGTITVTSRSIYSVRRSTEEPDEDKEENSRDSEFGTMDDLEESGTGFEVLDDQLVSGSTSEEDARRKEVERVQSHADTDVRTYDFAYEDNRWVLKSKLNPETEKSIESAVERALRVQP